VSRTGRLRAVLLLNLSLVAALVAVGLAADSLGVLAEGIDYLADAAVVGASLLAIALSRRPPTARHPRGHRSATTLAAALNGAWVVALSALVAVGAVHRLATGAREVQGLPVLIVSGVAAAVMGIGVLILRGDDDAQDDDAQDDRSPGDALNLRAVLLDTIADAAAAAGVAAAGAIIYVTGGLFWLDPAIALVIALVVGHHGVRLLAEISRTSGSLRAAERRSRKE